MSARIAIAPGRRRARALIAIAFAAGCADRSVAPTTAPPPPRTQPAAAPVLPGALWFVGDGKLTRLAGGTRLDVVSDVALFPSRHVLPDGRLVAIASRGDGSARSEQLALIARDGAVTRLGPAAPTVRDPAVDPAGAWITVAANLDGRSELYRITVATARVERLTDDAHGNFTPAILGDDLVFASSRDGDSEIYTLARGRLTAFHRDDFGPVPAPGGATLLFHSDREGPIRLFASSPTGTELRRLTDRRAGEGDEVEPVWSPDGTRVAYEVVDRAHRTVYLREVATGRERALTPPGARDGEVTMSPDGAWLAVAREQARRTTIVAIRIADGYTVDVAPGRLPRWL